MDLSKLDLRKGENKMKQIYNEVDKPVMVHGGMWYECENKKCKKRVFLALELGVEDFGRNGKPHQPCPFMIPCECGDFKRDVSGYMPCIEIGMLAYGMRYFAYDNSGSDQACGQLSIYKKKEEPNENHRGKQL